MNKENFVMLYTLYRCSIKAKRSCQISVSELKQKMAALEPGEMVCVKLISEGGILDDRNIPD